MVGSRQLLEAYHADNPFSFGGKKHVRKSIKIKPEQLNRVLSKSNIYTGFREFKKPKKTPPIRTHGPDYLWEADLMFFTHPDFASANEGYLYILAFIDTFTKEVGVAKLKTKDTKTVTEKFRSKFNVNKPKYLRVDAGGEFLSHTFIKLCKDYDVKMYVAMEPIKCAFIERFNRTFKRILIQLMEHHNSVRWIDYVEQTVDIYHSREHSSIGMSPDDAMDEENHLEIFQRNLKKYSNDDRKIVKKNTKPSKFKRGQIVKVFRKKGVFTRGFNKSVTSEYFEIYHVNRQLSKDRYYIKDLQGDKIIGSFYEEYLVPFTPPSDGGEYLLDPKFTDFKRRNIRGVPHIWIKWLGWPDKFNQWIPEKDVRHLLPQNIS
jgi:hypothetical protein